MPAGVAIDLKSQKSDMKRIEVMKHREGHLNDIILPPVTSWCFEEAMRTESVTAKLILIIPKTLL